MLSRSSLGREGLAGAGEWKLEYFVGLLPGDEHGAELNAKPEPLGCSLHVQVGSEIMSTHHLVSFVAHTALFILLPVLLPWQLSIWQPL